MLAPFRASADQATRGSRFSSRSASGRLMMGSEGWGGNNLNRALAAHQRQERGTLRTHPTRRPREDIFLPEQNALSACRSSWPVQATEGTAALSLRQRNSLPSTHIRCSTTARRLATATMARRIPRRWATRTPHAFSHDHFPLWVSSECAAFSIAASVKPRPGYLMHHPLVLRLL